MKKNIVYYHSRSISENPDRGSDLRVVNMLKAFEQTNYKVIVVAGNAKTRHASIKQLKADIEGGLVIEFVYGESTNAPILLADKRLTPSNIFADYAFFAWLKRMKIPFGTFYRDVYWRFDFFSQQLPWPFGFIVRPLYYLDWYVYDKYCSILFLPSRAMNSYLPHTRSENRFEALPPGFNNAITPRPPFDTNSRQPLKLLYVGGIEPSVYDIEHLLKIVTNRDDIQLTICCRAPEWEKHRHKYENYITANIKLIHVTSDELVQYYHEADLFLMLMTSSEYRDFAAPVKLYEAIGYCTPIVSLDHKEVARHIRAADIGWVLDDIDQFDPLLLKLTTERGLLAEKYRNLLNHRQLCSWQARAASATEYLLNQQNHQQEPSET